MRRVFFFVWMALLPLSARAETRRHQVIEGDTLGELAAHYEVELEALRTLNDLSNDVLRVGQTLRIDPEPALEHVTVPGDTLRCIAARYGVTLERILEDNPHVSRSRLEVGQRLELRGAVDRRVSTSASEGRYTVAAGETLSALAERFGLTVASLTTANENIDPDRLTVGMSLRVPGGVPRSHRVSAGENLTRIARAYDVTVADLRARNGSTDADRLRVGQRLRVPPAEVVSASVGAPNCGFIRGSVGLGTHAAYVLREPSRAFGTRRTVERIRRAFDRLRRRHPHAMRVRVHDLSLDGGGPIDDHRSHQSGRDVDITYYQRRGCRAAGCPLRRVEPATLDARRQWTLLSAWLRSEDAEAIYLDYALQAPLYREARRRGASAAQLRTWFQYPRGRWARSGTIRHFPHHRDHFHVRFACGDGDEACR